MITILGLMTSRRLGRAHMFMHLWPNEWATLAAEMSDPLFRCSERF
jgi:hypothetical protein